MSDARGPSPDPAPPRPRRRTICIALLAVAAIVVGAAIVALARWALVAPAFASFFAEHDGIVLPPAWAPVGIPAWVGVLHGLNSLLLGLIVVSGLRVRGRTRPPAFVTRRNTGRLRTARPPRRLSLHVWWHLVVDTGWVAVGVVYVVLLFATGHWTRIVPTSWEVFPEALVAATRFAALQWPPHEAWIAYNALQQLTYFAVVFVVAPLSILTGLRLSPAWREEWRSSRILTEARARRIHTLALVLFIAFVAVHLALVLLTGVVENLGHMYAASPEGGWLGVVVFAVSSLITVAAWTLLRPPAQTALAERVADVRRMPR